MRIADKIANSILDMLENEYNFTPKKKVWLDCECAIADEIISESKKWLTFDIDMQEFTE